MGINNAYTGPADLPDVLPVFPLSGALLLPRSEMGSFGCIVVCSSSRVGRMGVTPADQAPS